MGSDPDRIKQVKTIMQMLADMLSLDFDDPDVEQQLTTFLIRMWEAGYMITKVPLH